VEQPGTIRVVRDGRELGAPFLDLRRRISRGDERGLLSMAFAPDYASSGLFYVYFTDGRGDIRVEEYRRSRRAPTSRCPRPGGSCSASATPTSATTAARWSSART
jgi:glucose/arabinose dehydrogenase